MTPTWAEFMLRYIESQRDSARRETRKYRRRFWFAVVIAIILFLTAVVDLRACTGAVPPTAPDFSPLIHLTWQLAGTGLLLGVVLYIFRRLMP